MCLWHHHRERSGSWGYRAASGGGSPLATVRMRRRLCSGVAATKVQTGCASPGAMPVFPGPHGHTEKLTGILVGCVPMIHPPSSARCSSLDLITDLEQ